MTLGKSLDRRICKIESVENDPNITLKMDKYLMNIHLPSVFPV